MLFSLLVGISIGVYIGKRYDASRMTNDFKSFMRRYQLFEQETLDPNKKVETIVPKKRRFKKLSKRKCEFNFSKKEFDFDRFRKDVQKFLKKYEKPEGDI